MESSPDARRVLVIDDSEDAAETLRTLLEIVGYRVEVAHDGRHGLDVATRFLPEIVLCDIGLPGMDGFDVARALRRDPKLADAYLVAVTGYAEDEDQARALEVGFDAHLPKPADFSALRDLMARASRRRA